MLTSLCTNQHGASQSVYERSELSKVVACFHWHRKFLSVHTLSYCCFIRLY
nr:MAG TPA: hypothetical protein [Caudoviricetes sp.]